MNARSTIAIKSRAIRTILAAASLSLSACMAVSDSSVQGHRVLPPPDLSETIGMDALAGATPLDTHHYRPLQILPSCGGKPLPEGRPGQAFSAALGHADAYSRKMGGMGLVVLHEGKVVHANYVDGMDPTRQFTSASMMKSVTGLLAGIAIADGLIGSADDPVGDYLEEWRDDPRGAITLRQLLTMSSGLNASGFRDFLFAPDANRAALAVSLAREPGVQFYYDNAVSQIVGAIIDRQARAKGGGGFAQYLHDRLWCPLGNGEATMWVDRTGMPRAYAGLQAGMADWARIGELIRMNGLSGARQIVPDEWIAQMAQPSTVNDQYGFLLWRAGTWTERRSYNHDNPVGVTHSAPFVATDLVYLDGFGGQRVYIMPSHGLTIVRASLVDLEYDDAIIPNLLANATTKIDQ